jgi:hypothetical protein
MNSFYDEQVTYTSYDNEEVESLVEKYNMGEQISDYTFAYICVYVYKEYVIVEYKDADIGGYDWCYCYDVFTHSDFMNFVTLELEEYMSLSKFMLKKELNHNRN